MRSSAVPEDGCHVLPQTVSRVPAQVAILSRPGGRLPPVPAFPRKDTMNKLRSSAVPEDGCHSTPSAGSTSWSSGCDPQPSRRTAATGMRDLATTIRATLRSSAVPEDGCHAGDATDRPWPKPLRSSAVPEDGCHHRSSGCRPRRRWGCDPQPSRRTAATRTLMSLAHARAALRSSAVPEDGCHRAGVAAVYVRGDVAILSRPGGRLPPRGELGVGVVGQVLRSSAVPEDGCHHGSGHDVRPGGHVAILSRPGGRLPRHSPLRFD
mgnify:CR=1 FL=1